MKLTKSQQKAVSQLVNFYLESVNNNKKEIIDFQAPTGSGKTFIITNTINEIIKTNKANGSPQKLIFVIATLSSADLPFQLEQNMNEYKYYINGLFDVELKESPSSKNAKKDSSYNILAEENKVIIFGSSSFGKGRIITEEGILDAFLDEIKSQGYTLVYIRDEAHHGGNVNKTKIFEDFDEKIHKNSFKKEETRFEYKIQEAASFIIKMTATPKGIHKLVFIDEKDLMDDDTKLLKDEHVYNLEIKELKEENIDDELLLTTACEQFLKIKEQYSKAKELKNIRPAMLIQVENEPNKKPQKSEFLDKIEKIIKILEKHNLSWVKYFSNDKEVQTNILINKKNNKISLKEISKKTSNVDVILFKIGPATGWNIPRACMLVQLRNVSSKNLSVQTIGRIKRFPNPSFDKNEISYNSISNQYFIYSNIISEDKIRQTLILKDKYKNDRFFYGEINQEKINNYLNGETYKEEIVEKFEDSISNFEYYVNEEYRENFVKNQYLEGETSKIEGKTRVYTKIKNSIELELYIIEQLRKYKHLFPQKIIDFLETKFNEWEKRWKLNISINMYWYVIIKEYLDQIEKIYKNSLEQMKKDNHELLFKLQNNKNLPNQNEIFIPIEKYKKCENMLDLNVCDKYAYKDLKEQNHYFDSLTESKFANRFLSLSNDNDKIKNNVELWTKNPVFHGLKYQYFNEDGQISNSYPDFILKIKTHDQKDHYLYIEVKKLYSDYDYEKTKLLIESYQRYIENKNNNDNLILDELDKAEITILVCYINMKNQKDFYFYGASSNDVLNKKVNFDLLKNTSINKTPEQLVANKAKFIIDIKHLLDFLL
ncbi:DEAD/DEAH box helicase family protein [Ureaplasma urealyticum]|uniref:DEAD/DEAH box helicase family protein n=1 Tax=Ureaplasma urealyticum TaxID=2130 RepID=UPI00307CF2CD